MSIPLIGQPQGNQLPVSIGVEVGPDGRIAIRYTQGMVQIAPGMDLANAKMIHTSLGEAIAHVEQLTYAATIRNGE